LGSFFLGETEHFYKQKRETDQEPAEKKESREQTIDCHDQQSQK